MAEVRTIIIDVKDGEVDALNSKLATTDTNISKVERSTKKASGEIKKSSVLVRTLDRLTGGLASSFLDVADGIKKANFNLVQTRALLSVIGAGAFVAGAALLVLYWEEIYDWVTRANVELERQVELSKQRQTQLEFQLEILEKQAKLAEIEGRDNKELLELQKQRLTLLIEENKFELNKLKTIHAQLAARAAEITLGERIRGFLTGGVPGGLTGSQEDLTKLIEVGKLIQDNEKALLDFQIKLADLNNPKAEGGKAAGREKEQKVNPLTGESVEAENERIRKIFEDKFDLQKEGQDALLESSQNALDRLVTSEEYAEARRTLTAEQQAAARKAIAENEFKAKQRNLFAYADAAQAVGSLIGQETAAGKALSVAAALINTYASIAGQLRAFAGVPVPGYAIAQAIATAAVGFKAVKDIIAVKVPGASGGANISTPIAPAFNVVQASGQNQLNQALLERNNQPIEAFVTEGQVSTSQELKRKKVAASSF